VTTNAATEFKHLLCSEVAEGMMVRVRGLLQSGGVVLASRVVDRDRNDDDDDDDVDENEVEGPIASMSSGCPAPTFVVGTMTVMTNSLTVFDDITCGDLAVGLDIEAKGARQEDGSLLATRIELRRIQ
jgi:hypothetical protein